MARIALHKASAVTIFVVAALLGTAEPCLAFDPPPAKYPHRTYWRPRRALDDYRIARAKLSAALGKIELEQQSIAPDPLCSLDAHAAQCELKSDEPRPSEPEQDAAERHPDSRETSSR